MTSNHSVAGSNPAEGAPTLVSVQEFRPASVIAADNELAERFHDGEPDAIRSLVDRYGAAVTAAVTSAVGVGARDAVACNIFVQAHREPIAPGDDFATWLCRLAEQHAGAVDERLWSLARATSAVDGAVRTRLRDYHLDHHLNEGHPNEGSELAHDLERPELRLRRRLAPLGEEHEILAALADPDAWVEADADLAECVLDGIGRPHDSRLPAGGESDPSVATRLLRPVLFGLGGGLVVLFVAIVALSAASGTPTQPDFTTELTPTGAIVEVEGGEITVTARDAGIEIELDAPTLPRRAAGAYYEGRVILADGSEVPAGSFAEGGGVTLWVGAELDDAVGFEVLTRDIAAPDDAGEPVLKADLVQE